MFAIWVAGEKGVIADKKVAAIRLAVRTVWAMCAVLILLAFCLLGTNFTPKKVSLWRSTLCCVFFGKNNFILIYRVTSAQIDFACQTCCHRNAFDATIPVV